MKKIIALMLAALLCVSLLAACGGDNGGSGGGDNGGNSTGVNGQTFDAGNVSVLVPNGWKAFTVADIWSDDPNATNPNSVNIVKGGETEIDLLSKPYVNVTYYSPDTYMVAPTKSMYDDAADIDDVTIGSYTWHGFTCSSFGYKYYMLWTGEQGSDQFQVNVLYESTGGSFDFNDADVQAIIASVAPSKK